MLNVVFILNDYFLVSYILTNHSPNRFVDYISNESKKNIVDFQNLAWNKSVYYYDLIRGKSSIFDIIPSLRHNKYHNLGIELDNYIEDLIKSNEYNLLKDQTLESIDTCKFEWISNFEKTSKYINDLGIKIDEEFKIWITHPGLKAGRYLGNDNIIWSHQTYWPNYNTIYIWHEILHSYFDHSDYQHALIELITDNQMKKLLNGDQYPPFEGHEFLNRQKEELFPIWDEYLKQDRKNINDLLKKLPRDY